MHFIQSLHMTGLLGEYIFRACIIPLVRQHANLEICEPSLECDFETQSVFEIH